MTIGETTPAPKKNGARTNGEGPGQSYVGIAGIAVAAVYLVVVMSLSLYSIVKLWPHPTPSGEPPTSSSNTDTAATDTTGSSGAKGTPAPPTGGKGASASSDRIPQPKPEDIKTRQDRLCATSDTKCRECVAREMQLEYDSQHPNDPQCTYIFGCHVIIWQEERLLLLVFLAGAIGALLHAVRSLMAYVGNRKFVRSWLAFYYLSPFAGASLAFISYLVIRGGFLSSTTTTKDTNTFMFVALGALSGLFSQQVMEKLKRIAETAFDKPEDHRDSLDETKPVIESLNPDHVPVNFADSIQVTGQRFAKDAAVSAGGQAAETTFVNDRTLTFKLPASIAGATGSVDVVVQNPGATGGKSAAKPLTIAAAEKPAPPPPAKT